MLEPPALNLSIVRHFIPISPELGLDVLVIDDELLVLLAVGSDAWMHLETAGEC